MVKRVSNVVLFWCGVGVIISFLICISPVGRHEIPALVTLSPSGTAYAQEPAGQLLYRVVAAQSETRYRVREQLAGFNLPNDAVGATRAIEGGIALDAQGHVLSKESRLTVDLTKLLSDKDRRDSYLRRNTLDTERYPTTVFVPTEVRGLSFPFPQDGSASFELVGDLTVRGVTKRVTWGATADFNGQDIRVQAKTAFRFEEFNLSIPRVASVLSVDDHIQLEADLLLRPSS
jgi:polyisoprenoid-binding protein YceI